MLLFAHIGITAGVVRACDILVSKSRPDNCSEPNCSSRVVIGNKQLYLNYLLNRINSRVGSIDYRMVLLGSLLPDIIDKPLWFLTGGNIFASGIDYGHTLLLNLALFICGLILAGYRKSWLLIISLCSFMHLILDQMWRNPATLWWPLLGAIPERETTGWLLYMTQRLFSYPSVYIPEIIGLVIISLFVCRLVMRKGVISFIKGGAIG